MLYRRPRTNAQTSPSTIPGHLAHLLAKLSRSRGGLVDLFHHTACESGFHVAVMRLRSTSLSVGVEQGYRELLGLSQSERPTSGDHVETVVEHIRQPRVERLSLRARLGGDAGAGPRRAILIVQA